MKVEAEKATFEGNTVRENLKDAIAKSSNINLVLFIDFRNEI